MKATRLFVRFFRSFNFDYLRRAHDGWIPDPWDSIDEHGNFPFVCIPLEPDITTIVGANESGKSQLLSALKFALSGKDIVPSDFCRYSVFFAVDHEMAKPDFGLQLTDLSGAEEAALRVSFGLATDVVIGPIGYFRFNGRRPTLFLETATGWARYEEVNPTFDGLMPGWFEINSQTPLPDSVSIAALASGSSADGDSRASTRGVIRALLGQREWFSSAATVVAAAPQISATVTGSSENRAKLDAEFHLADDLLVKIAGIDRSAFVELEGAVAAANEGYANGIVDRLNKQLAGALNFPKWWSQDNQFELLLSLREMDLAFTIRDRTGTEYSFRERSGGLKYFLSYFVQHLAHDWIAGRPEFLLMDEPDAYLSSQGQQDLLRIFDSFVVKAREADTNCQVVFVTHSPFLVDKNHGERIRVLEKGQDEEGTRVVNNASRNHYEPLRSAFGAFVGETAFIGNANLMLEGISDQVLLAGMSSRLRRRGLASIDNIDLNSSTLVPAGSASQIPYMVFLAVGRDVDRPAIVALLDSDAAGDSARKTLLKGGPYQKRLLAAEFILQIGELAKKDLTIANPEGPREIEDLVPPAVLDLAVRGYVQEFLGSVATETLGGLPSGLSFVASRSSHDAAEQKYRGALGADFHLDKLGLARHVLAAFDSEMPEIRDDISAMSTNFAVLLSALAKRQRGAMRELRVEQMSSKINRLRKAFLAGHESSSSKEDALVLLEDIEGTLDAGFGAEELKAAIRQLRSTFGLTTDVTENINDYHTFVQALESLAYIDLIESQGNSLSS